MTIEEATGEYQYDVGIFAMVDKELTGGKLKWYWDINGWFLVAICAVYHGAHAILRL